MATCSGLRLSRRERQHRDRLDSAILIGAGATGTQPIDGARARQQHDPARHARARRIVAAGLAPDLREDVLDDLLGQVLLGEDPPGETVGRRGVPIVEAFQSVRRSAGDRRQNLTVGLDRSIRRESGTVKAVKTVLRVWRAQGLGNWVIA